MSTTLPADTHTHTALCHHAEGRPLDYARTAKARGLQEICITDHVPAPGGYDASSRMDADEFPHYLDWVGEAVNAFPGFVKLGIEADYHPGCEDYLPAFLEKTPFELVMGSVHFIGDWGFDNPATLPRWEKADISAVWDDYLALVKKLVDMKCFDALSHFDLPKKFGHRLPEAIMLNKVRPVLDLIAASGMAMELNTGGLRKPVKEIYPSLSILTLMRERNIPILFGSDAHAPNEVGCDFERAVALAKQAGYTSYVRFSKRKAISESLP